MYSNSDVSAVVAVCAFIRSVDQLGTVLAVVQDMWLSKVALFSLKVNDLR